MLARPAVPRHQASAHGLQPSQWTAPSVGREPVRSLHSALSLGFGSLLLMPEKDEKFMLSMRDLMRCLVKARDGISWWFKIS